MLKDITVGFALTGSFCTLKESLLAMEELSKTGCTIVPIVSDSVMTTDTRFGKAQDFIQRIEELSGRRVISTIAAAEPIGPKGLLDILVVMPATGNTLSKLYHGITDTPVVMACKAHLRNGRPLLLAAATNDALSINAKTIGGLMNQRNIYFLPMGQDDSAKKPTSVIADFTMLLPAIYAALEGKRLQPQLF